MANRNDGKIGRYMDQVMSGNHPRVSTPQMSREFELILCCAHTTLDPAVATSILAMLHEGVNWAEVTANAIHHELSPLVLEHLVAVGGDLVPQVWRDALRENAEGLESGQSAIFAETVRITELLKSEQIQCFPFQFPVLGWLCPRGLTIRGFANLEIVIAPRDASRAAEILTCAGYRSAVDPMSTRASESKRGPGPYRLESERGWPNVELHTARTLNLPPVFHEPSESTQDFVSLQLGRRKILASSTEDALLMLCLSGAKYSWDRLSFVWAVSELLRLYPMNWDTLRRNAERLKCVRLLLMGVQLASDLLGAPLPDVALARIQKDLRVPWLAERAKEQVLRTNTRGIVGKAAFRVLSRDNLSEGLRQTMWIAMSPIYGQGDASSQALKSVVFSALARPWRLLREQGMTFRRRERSYRGALFEPTPQPLVDHGLRLAEVGPDDVLYDLGCGDGIVVLTAAKKFGARAVGVDIDPRLIASARSSARKQGVQQQVEFVLQDANDVDISRATVVWLFVGPEGNLRLMERLKSQLRPGARVVSVAFRMAGWPPDKQEIHTLPDGDSRPLFLWRI
jgi:hypothetical protein